MGSPSSDSCNGSLSCPVAPRTPINSPLLSTPRRSVLRWGGLTIDRRETINTLDQMSRDEITARLAALQKQYPQAFQIDSKVEDAEVIEPLAIDQEDAR